jgi:hypothetical protein
MVKVSFNIKRCDEKYLINNRNERVILLTDVYRLDENFKSGDRIKTPIGHGGNNHINIFKSQCGGYFNDLIQYGVGHEIIADVDIGSYEKCSKNNFNNINLLYKVDGEYIYDDNLPENKDFKWNNINNIPNKPCDIEKIDVFKSDLLYKVGQCDSDEVVKTTINFINQNIVTSKNIIFDNNDESYFSGSKNYDKHAKDVNKDLSKNNNNIKIFLRNRSSTRANYRGSMCNSIIFTDKDTGGKYYINRSVVFLGEWKN